MRRAIATAVVAGAAGIMLGLAPMGSAVAAGLPATLPQTGWCAGDWHGQDWYTCCDPSRGDARPSWCWDSSNWNHDSNWDHNWNHGSSWDDNSWNHDNNSWNHDDSWNHDSNWNDGNWNSSHDSSWSSSHDSSWNSDHHWR
ncbi:hypothetical protein [Streptomyces sp. G-G2]|uniref:hypothetical protein n=1 Tax=Streptomyces sp. G-G2 TaxID=3046201 RepID=UPI0024BAF025|nr:hypothetical protein [Streptomyces sp. G-G2]MDJ0380199.1 hypothetical protein [Streptomyces sp. G-G2]